MVPLSSTWNLSDGDPSYLKLTTGMKSCRDEYRCNTCSDLRYHHHHHHHHHHQKTVCFQVSNYLIGPGDKTQTGIAQAFYNPRTECDPIP